jgi:ABC-2 type transport system ATP-binding protein
MKVREYLSFMAELRDIPRGERLKSIGRVKESCGLESVFEREIRELSKGYRQRVGLAQAMVHNPDILIMDEPTSGLDPNQIVEVRNLIKEIGVEKTVILSTHTLVEVALTCDRILVIHNGRIVAEGALDDLRARSGLKDKAHIGLAGDAASLAGGLEKLPGVKAVTREGASGALERFVLTLEAGTRIEEALFILAREKNCSVGFFEVERTTLEQVFNALTVGEEVRS